MRYDKYLNRINKLNKVINALYRLRFVLASVASVTLVGVLTFEFTKGIVKVENFNKLEFTYGDVVTAASSAFANDSKIEYREVNSDNWSEIAPTYPGKYQVRGVSKNGFGAMTTSDPIDFEILPKEVEVSIGESQITYGNVPKISASLLGMDKISAYKVKYDDPYSLKTKAQVDKESMTVTDKDGKDITFCYNFTPKQRDIDILPRQISISFKDNEKTYDAKAIEEFDGELVSGTLAEDDVISYKENAESHSEVGNYTYSKETVIKHNDKDVTHMYSVNTQKGNLKIDKIPLTAYSLDYHELYNGKTLDENNAYQVKFECPKLVEGHKVNISFEGDYEELKDSNKPLETDSIFSIKITNEKDEDVTSSYDIQKTYGSISVSKRDISIAFGSNSKLYDGTKLSETLYSVSGDLLEGDIVKVDPNDEDLFPKIVEPGTVENIVESIQINNDKALDVTNCYNISLIPGELEIRKPHLVFDMPSFGDIEYDGKSHILSDFKLNEVSDVVSSNFVFDLKDPEECIYPQNEPYVSNRNIDISLNDVDVTQFFDIEYNRPESWIRKRKINPVVYFIEEDTTSALTYNGAYREVNVKFNDGEILEGDVPSLNTNMLLDSGTYELVEDLGFAINNPILGDVTSFYEIETVNSLVINKKDIYVTLPSFDTDFDGKMHEAHLDMNQFSDDNALYGDCTITETAYASGTYFGDYDYSKDFISFSNDDNYRFIFDSDSKTSHINKRKLEVNFTEFDKTYNGDYQNIEFNITDGSLADGDSFVKSKYNGTSYVSDSLLVKNRKTYTKNDFIKKDDASFFNEDGTIKILNSSGYDVTDNYEIVDNFDDTKFEVKPFELTVNFNDFDYDKYYNGMNYEFKLYDLDGKELPEGQRIEVENAFIAKHANDEYINDKKATVKIYDESGTQVTGNYSITIKYTWDTTTIYKKPITIGVSDFTPTYDGTSFVNQFDPVKFDYISIISGELLENTTMSVSYKGAKDSPFIKNESLMNLIDINLVNEDYEFAESDYDITYEYFGNCDYQKRDLTFIGKRTVHGTHEDPDFTYNGTSPTSLNDYVVQYGDEKFYSLHQLSKDEGAVTTNGIYAGDYDFICDPTKFHLKNKNVGYISADDYVVYNFDQIEGKVVIGVKQINVLALKDVFNYGEKPKAYERFSVTGLLPNHYLYLVYNGISERVTDDTTDYIGIDDMIEKGSYKYKCGGHEITNNQFKVFEEMEDGTLLDRSTSHTIVVDKEKVKRGFPIWIN